MKADAQASEILDFSLVPRRVARVLEQDIIFLRMAPDSRVIEEEIAERFGVSRSPVRESIRFLERDGLVVRAERRGARVSPISRRNLDEVYACRLSLEGIAAAEAALHRKAANLAELRDCLVRQREALGRIDIAAYFRANVAFTDAIHNAAENVTLRLLLRGIGKQALRYRYFAYRAAPQLTVASSSGSKGVMEAIRKCDRNAARAQTERLIERSWKTVRKFVPE